MVLVLTGSATSSSLGYPPESPCEQKHSAYSDCNRGCSSCPCVSQVLIPSCQCPGAVLLILGYNSTPKGPAAWAVCQQQHHRSLWMPSHRSQVQREAENARPVPTPTLLQVPPSFPWSWHRHRVLAGEVMLRPQHHPCTRCIYFL